MMWRILFMTTVMLLVATLPSMAIQDCIRTSDGHKCVLPFSHAGKTFSKCTTEGGYDSWCAFKVDGNGEMTKGDWDYCKRTCADCETKGGYGPCTFPFIFGGKKHNSCIQDPDDTYEPWCAYMTDGDSRMTEWAYCETDGNCTVVETKSELNIHHPLSLVKYHRIQ